LAAQAPNKVCNHPPRVQESATVSRQHFSLLLLSSMAKMTPPPSLALLSSKVKMTPQLSHCQLQNMITVMMMTVMSLTLDNFRMNTGYGRYDAGYNMVALSCFNDELPCV
jgi:hypothetical protein